MEIKNLLIVLLFLIMSQSVLAIEPDSEEVLQRDRQVFRLIGDAIAYRLSGLALSRNRAGPIVSADFVPSARLNSAPMAASADNVSATSVWSSFSYSEISDDNFPDHVDNDIYQLIGGIDRQYGDWVLGTALTYSYSEMEFVDAFGSFDLETHGISLNPYLAYLFDEYFFVSGILGYNFNDNENFLELNPTLDFHQHIYTAEINLNGLKVMDDWIFKGRIGPRYSHIRAGTESRPIVSIDETRDSLTWILDTEVMYQFAPGWLGYGGVQYEYNDTEDDEENAYIFFRVGLDYLFSDTLSFGAKIQHEENDEDFDIFSAVINVRYAF